MGIKQNGILSFWFGIGVSRLALEFLAAFVDLEKSGQGLDTFGEMNSWHQ